MVKRSSILDALEPPVSEQLIQTQIKTAASIIAHINSLLEFTLNVRGEFEKELRIEYGDALPRKAKLELSKLTVSCSDISKLLESSSCSMLVMQSALSIDSLKKDCGRAKSEILARIFEAVRSNPEANEADEKFYSEIYNEFDGKELKAAEELKSELIKITEICNSLILQWDKSELKNWTESIAICGITRKVGEYKSQRKRVSKTSTRRKVLKAIWDKLESDFSHLPVPHRIEMAIKKLRAKSLLVEKAGAKNPQASHRKTIKTDLLAIYGKGGNKGALGK